MMTRQALALMSPQIAFQQKQNTIMANTIFSCLFQME
jgi:hypothetical protein